MPMSTKEARQRAERQVTVAMIDVGGERFYEVSNMGEITRCESEDEANTACEQGRREALRHLKEARG